MSKNNMILNTLHNSIKSRPQIDINNNTLTIYDNSQFKELSSIFLQNNLIINGNNYNSISNYVYYHMLENPVNKTKMYKEPPIDCYNLYSTLSDRELSLNISKILEYIFKLKLKENKNLVDELIKTNNVNIIYDDPKSKLFSKQIGPLLKQLRQEYLSKHTQKLSEIENTQIYDSYKISELIKYKLQRDMDFKDYITKSKKEILSEIDTLNIRLIPKEEIMVKKYSDKSQLYYIPELYNDHVKLIKKYRQDNIKQIADKISKKSRTKTSLIKNKLLDLFMDNMRFIYG
jgi:hypothetical protein